jgi:predicted dehydrogenase
MKLCVIGSRGHQAYVIDGLREMPLVKVVGISAGSEEDDAREITGMFGDLGRSAEVYSDYRLMLDELDPDVVSIAGPLEEHAQMCIEAFQRGIHVFCEKPVATTMSDLKRLKNAYAETDSHFAAMMGMRYDPAFYAAWRAVRDGEIGRVRLINAQKSYKLGQRPEYYWRRETYGGTIPWVGSHAIDWIKWFSRERFRTVYATHTSRYNNDYGELETLALCHFTLTDDVFASASIDYLRPAAAATHGDDRIRVVGTEGTIEVRMERVFLISDETEGTEELEAKCDRQIFRDFVEQIKGSGVGLMDAEDIFEVTEACLLARRSADVGHVINFEAQN